MVAISARRTIRRLGVAGLLACVFVTVSPVALVARASTSPSRWNPQIEPVAKEVEALRHLKFDHPVNVRFLTESTFAKQQRADRSKLSASDQAELARAQSQLRALGLIGQDVDLFDAANDISSTNVLAYYDPKTERVTVRGKGAIDVATRVTLAHELTHALQDQHFDLAKVRKAADTHHAQTTARAVIEGDAVRIQTLYRRKLSNADEQAYLDASRGESDEAQADAMAKDIPQTLLALFDAPYAFGPALVQVAESKLGGGIDGLFRNVPTNDTAFLTPSTLVDGARFTTVGKPSTTKSEKLVGRPDVFGAYALYLVLASRLGPSAALEVADGWGGDSMITLKRHGHTCLRATFVGRGAERTAAIGGALEEWSSAMPKGTATVARGRSGVSLTACDTGATVSPTPHDAEEATTFAASRNTLYSTLLQQGASSKAASCTANHLVRDPAFAPLLADPNADPDAETLDALRDRATSIGRDCVVQSQS